MSLEQGGLQEHNIFAEKHIEDIRTSDRNKYISTILNHTNQSERKLDSYETTRPDY